jgi:hypothetical protein
MTLLLLIPAYCTFHERLRPDVKKPEDSNLTVETMAQQAGSVKDQMPVISNRR